MNVLERMCRGYAYIHLMADVTDRINLISHCQTADIQKSGCPLEKMPIAKICNVVSTERRRAARHRWSANASMCMRIDDTWYDDAASGINDCSSRDFVARASTPDLDIRDPSALDVDGSSFVKRLAIAGDEGSIADNDIHDDCSFLRAVMQL
ncbi:hypothetical protein [Rhizobium azibense]|uniref:hypothetical protein n=1 Tax=Rhizobium azibense TaxID=1136135 RepID=UPI00315C6B88